MATEVCSNCNGEGQSSWNGPHGSFGPYECPDCEGKGEVQTP